RKLRLFACACCRRIWGLFPDEGNRDLVAAVERSPDGTRDYQELWGAIVASSRRESECRDHPAYWAAKYLGRGFYHLTPPGSAVAVALRAATSVPEGAGREAERASQAALVRCVFGNPFRPVLVDPAWLAWHGGAVGKLARAVYDDRQLPSGHLGAARLAVLADMLEEAGCSDAQSLEHLPGARPPRRAGGGAGPLTGRHCAFPRPR